MKATDLAQALAERIEDVCRVLLPLGRREGGLWRDAHRVEGGRGDSLHVHVAGPHRGRWRHWAEGIGGDLLDLIVYTKGVSLTDALRWATVWIGDADSGQDSRPRDRHHEAARDVDRAQRARQRQAMAIWAEAGPITGTMAAEYLRRRRLDPDLVGDDVVRFHPRCPRGASEKLPALIWLFTHIITLKPCGVLRVYLIQHQDGAVTKIEDGAAKLSLGRTAGAVVRLSPDDEVERGLGVAEGTETALAILSAGWHPIWATGGTAGLTAFPVLDGIEVLTIFSDADPPGRRAAETCAKRWAEAGREVAIFEPHTEGTDFNDTIREVAA